MVRTYPATKRVRPKTVQCRPRNRKQAIFVHLFLRSWNRRQQDDEASAPSRCNSSRENFFYSIGNRIGTNFRQSIQERRHSRVHYVFPLYDGVSVVAFTCEVGSRVIHGIVKRNAETKKAFDKAVSRGEIAGTLEQGPSTDVFVTTIGNIRAGEKLQVRIKYIGELKHDLILEGIRFTLPMIISPRFGTGGPQGNMESSLAGGISITVDVSMPSECPIQEVRSPSHPIGLFLGRVSTQGNDYPDLTKASATLSLGTSTLDKDFVLEVCHKDGGKPRALLENHPTIDGQRALMTTLVPQLGKAHVEKPEIIIVADQSGSMQGGRTFTLVAARRVLLKSLPVGINFNICAFGSGYTFLWRKSHVYDEVSLAEALPFIETFSAHLGGTETLSAVQASIESRDADQKLSLILANDGDIWQQAPLFSYLEYQLANSKRSIHVFPLGIGNSVSSGLIEGIARAGRGFSSSVGEAEKLDGKIVRMLKGAMTPDSSTLTMEVQYQKDSDEDGYELVERVTDSLRIVMVDDVGSTEGLAASAMVVDDAHLASDRPASTSVIAPKVLQAPQVLPPLYPRTRTTVYLLLSPQATRAVPKTVILRDDSPENRFEILIPVEVLPEPGTTIHSLAAKRAILELEEGHGWLNHARDANNELVKATQPPEKYGELVENEAVRLGVANQIIGKYTSFVALESNSAWDKGEEPTERDITIIAPRPDPTKVTGDPFAISSRPPDSGGGSRYSSIWFRNGCSFSLSADCRKQPASQAARPSAPAAAAVPRALQAYIVSAGHREPTSQSASIDNCIDCEIDEPEAKRVKLDENEDEDDTADLLQRLIALQTFAGFWEYSKRLLEVCSVAVTEEVPQGVDSKVFATMLAVQFLEMKMGDEKEAWEMVVEKAMAWLEGQGVDGDGKRLEETARKWIERA